VAAEAAGYRPCLLCRPDRLPDTTASAHNLVERALVLITGGALDEETEDTLAGRLGVTARHLRRLFQEHVGATPAFVARSRRAHFARRLLDETELRIVDVAGASGFASVRQMNRVMRDVFRFTPAELRARRRNRDRLVADGGLRGDGRREPRDVVRLRASRAAVPAVDAGGVHCVHSAPRRVGPRLEEGFEGGCVHDVDSAAPGSSMSDRSGHRRRPVRI
jgi:methylphosphotriester-DNA--protein-cysteine methyltransferase